MRVTNWWGFAQIRVIFINIIIVSLRWERNFSFKDHWLKRIIKDNIVKN